MDLMYHFWSTLRTTRETSEIFTPKPSKSPVSSRSSGKGAGNRRAIASSPIYTASLSTVDDYCQSRSRESTIIVIYYCTVYCTLTFISLKLGRRVFRFLIRQTFDRLPTPFPSPPRPPPRPPLAISSSLIPIIILRQRLTRAASLAVRSVSVRVQVSVSDLCARSGLSLEQCCLI